MFTRELLTSRSPCFRFHNPHKLLPPILLANIPTFLRHRTKILTDSTHAVALHSTPGDESLEEGHYDALRVESTGEWIVFAEAETVVHGGVLLGGEREASEVDEAVDGR